MFPRLLKITVRWYSFLKILDININLDDIYICNSLIKKTIQESEKMKKHDQANDGKTCEIPYESLHINHLSNINQSRNTPK
ncbi:hypothetical protein EUGRSUZ_D00161 [Eucalyptus grandis]|uniref:Uncharacterized protein n=2 Tax=Eucalyptus grandis TaxID=71139 RepID=A0ACC3L1N9_EUCGR|nr:hypothetical protein EUGRSUZ_D00161 [Eucalyptus grandis]